MLQVFAVEESQMFKAVGDSDVTLMKDGGPLHWGTVQFLAGQAVADFGIHGICTHVVLNRTAIASRPILGNKIIITERSVI